MDSTFKSKFVAGGKAKGFLSSKGAAPDSELTLGEELLPYEAVIDTTTRDNRLILVLDLDTPGLGKTVLSNLIDNATVLETYGGKEEAIERTVDRFSSTLSAKRHRAELEAAGNGHAFRCTKCPACESTVNLTDYPKTNYVYCRSCESIFGAGLENLKGAKHPTRWCAWCGQEPAKTTECPVCRPAIRAVEKEDGQGGRVL